MTTVKEHIVENLKNTGLRDVADDSVSRLIIKSVVSSVFANVRVLLFGSRSRGTAVPDSDFDVLVVIDTTLEPEVKIRYKTLIRKRLLERGIIAELLIQSEEELLRKQRLTGHIVKTALAEGIWL